MNHPQYRPQLFDNPAHLRWLVRGLIALCMLLFGLDALLPRHAEHPWEGVFGFYALYGFVASVLLVLLAKELRKWVMRGSSYYDAEGDADDPEVDSTDVPSIDPRCADD